MLCSAPDVIVCIDACFTQKRRRRSGPSDDDDATGYPSIFLSKADINYMENYVSQCRLEPGGLSSNPSQDGYEGPLKVPASVLDGCNESFTAADEKRIKASTQFFSDTGLMAMLCRHDRVLWLANMTSAGEKQYYALALIKKLFENIPRTLTVGLLYDIACQLHRSFVKRSFLPQYSDRLTFGISVFHAYGHQWPCQVIYHSRKREGFGLSNGEGCERFWSCIKKLIPILRMSGVRSHQEIWGRGLVTNDTHHSKFHQRLSILDTQVRHICQTTLATLGDWLIRKWYRCQELKHEAETELKTIGISHSVLRDQWNAQVQKQTKPAPRELFITFPRVRLSVMFTPSCRTVQKRWQTRSRSPGHPRK